MIAYKTTEFLNEDLTAAPVSDTFSGDRVDLFSSGMEATALDTFGGDGAAMFSSGMVQMFSSGMAPKDRDLRLISGDGAEMFSSGM